MAGLQIDPTEIAKARESGYSDQEIADFLSTRAPDQFKAARDAGYGDKEILAHLSGEDDKPSGVVAGLREGVANLIHGPAETVKQFAGMDTAGAEKTAQQVAPENYKGAQVVPEGGHWYDPRTYNYSQIPQAIAEAAPGMAADITAAKLGSRINPLVGVGAGLASYLLRTRGDTAKQDAAIRTGNPDAEPETQDKVRSLATGAVESIPAAIGLGRFLPGANAVKAVGNEGVKQALAKALKTSGVEAATGATQNAVSQAGATVGTDKGLTVDPSQVVNAGITSGATGGMLAAPRGLADARGAKRYEKFGGDNENATKALMNRVNTALDGKGVDTGSSFEALRTADEGVRDELKAAVKPLKKSGTLDDETTDALKRASKGRSLTDTDLQNINTNATPDVAFLARQAHVASLVKQEGDFGGGKFVGGLANAVGKHIRAVQNPTGAAVSAGLGAASLGGHAASLFAYGPATLAAIAGGYAGMRGIDALTGNRTPLKGVLDRFADSAAPVRMPAPAAPVEAPPPTVGPTGPRVPFDPGVADGNLMRALGQNPFAPKVRPEAPGLTPAEMNEQVKSALLMAAARRKTAAQQAAAAAPAPLDVGSLNEQVKAALLMAGARRRAEGNAQAEGLAADSHVINENGGLDALRNPGFGKRANELLSAARARAQLLREPAPEGEAPGPTAPTTPAPPQVPPSGPVQPPSAPQAPVQPSGSPQGAPNAPVDPLVLAARAAKKIRKKNGKVHTEEPPSDDSSGFTGDYVPLTDKELFGRNMTDKQFAEHAAQEPGVKNPDAYADSVIRDRQKRRGVLADLTGDADIADQELAADLLHQLHHIRRGDKAAKAIKHYTEKMSPEMKAAVRKRMDASFVNSMWKV